MPHNTKNKVQPADNRNIFVLKFMYATNVASESKDFPASICNRHPVYIEKIGYYYLGFIAFLILFLTNVFVINLTLKRTKHDKRLGHAFDRVTGKTL